VRQAFSRRRASKVQGIEYQLAPATVLLASCTSCTNSRFSKPQNCRLTGRSTGPATAWHPGHEALCSDLAPRGQGAMPPRAGYLCVRRHVKYSNCLAAPATVPPASAMSLAVRHSSSAALRQHRRSGNARVLRRSRGTPQVREGQASFSEASRAIPLSSVPIALAPGSRGARRLRSTNSNSACFGHGSSGKLYLMHHLQRRQRPELPPNWSLNRTRNGMGPRGAAVHLAPRGPVPSRAG